MKLIRYLLAEIFQSYCWISLIIQSIITKHVFAWMSIFLRIFSYCLLSVYVKFGSDNDPLITEPS